MTDVHDDLARKLDLARQQLVDEHREASRLRDRSETTSGERVLDSLSGATAEGPASRERGWREGVLRVWRSATKPGPAPDEPSSAARPSGERGDATG